MTTVEAVLAHPAGTGELVRLSGNFIATAIEQ